MDNTVKRHEKFLWNSFEANERFGKRFQYNTMSMFMNDVELPLRYSPSVNGLLISYQSKRSYLKMPIKSNGIQNS